MTWLKWLGFFLLAVSCRAAQPVEGRFTAGLTTFADDSFVHNASVGGSLRTYISRRWSIEPEFLYSWHNGLVEDREYMFWANFSFDFVERGRRVAPYWFAAPGLHFHRSTLAPQTFSTTGAGLATGLGVRFYLSDRVFVAPQVRLGAAVGFFGEVTGSIGFVLRK